MEGNKAGQWLTQSGAKRNSFKLQNEQQKPIYCKSCANQNVDKTVSYSVEKEFLKYGSTQRNVNSCSLWLNINQADIQADLYCPKPHVQLITEEQFDFYAVLNFQADDNTIMIHLRQQDRCPE